MTIQIWNTGRAPYFYEVVDADKLPAADAAVAAFRRIEDAKDYVRAGLPQS